MNALDRAEILADNPPIQTQLRPEWLRVDVAAKLFGISRSKLYEFIADRRIKSFCLRERNKLKGIRLISFDSLNEFLEIQAKAQEAPAAEREVIAE
jgi:excisionase family DNA binding protein